MVTPGLNLCLDCYSRKPRIAANPFFPNSHAKVLWSMHMSVQPHETANGVYSAPTADQPLRHPGCPHKDCRPVSCSSSTARLTPPRFRHLDMPCGAMQCLNNFISCVKFHLFSLDDDEDESELETDSDDDDATTSFTSCWGSGGPSSRTEMSFLWNCKKRHVCSGACLVNLSNVEVGSTSGCCPPLARGVTGLQPCWTAWTILDWSWSAPCTSSLLLRPQNEDIFTLGT